LRRDGKYWFILENRAVTKREVERLLKKLHVDPDNLLIIMHQSMSEHFSIMSPQEKLKTVEEAVGLGSYRKNVLQARKKLSRILSEEDSVNRLLESAAQTLDYWREQYDRFQQKKQLQIKRRFLERELAWREAHEQGSQLRELETQLKAAEDEIDRIDEQLKELRVNLNSLQSKLTKLKTVERKLFEERVLMEREKGKREALQSLNARARNSPRREDAQRLMDNAIGLMQEFVSAVDQVEESSLNKSSGMINEKFGELKRRYKNLESTWFHHVNQRTDDLKIERDDHDGLVEKIDGNILETQKRVDDVDREIEDLIENIIDSRVNLAILEYKKQTIRTHLKKVCQGIRNRTEDFKDAVYRAEQTGPQIASARTPREILDEIRLTDGYLVAFGDVTEDIERMYESYSKLYLDLKEKARIVAENREKALLEVQARMDAWRQVLDALLEQVSLQYREILSHAQATGEVHLVNEIDIEAAGIEVLVGFTGTQPVPLDAYTQSGGERSMATISFLLALQQHVQSPFRAVDEYDVHMDPRNREVITHRLIESVRGSDSQYLIITPTQITFATADVHLITVQNIEGASTIREVVDKQPIPVPTPSTLRMAGVPSHAKT
jgi:chromosome segregation ATPase